MFREICKITGTCVYCIIRNIWIKVSTFELTINSHSLSDISYISIEYLKH